MLSGVPSSNQHSAGIKIDETRAEASRTEEILTWSVCVCVRLGVCSERLLTLLFDSESPQKKNIS